MHHLARALAEFRKHILPAQQHGVFATHAREAAPVLHPVIPGRDDRHQIALAECLAQVPRKIHEAGGARSLRLMQGRLEMDRAGIPYRFDRCLASSSTRRGDVIDTPPREATHQIEGKLAVVRELDCPL